MMAKHVFHRSPHSKARRPKLRGFTIMELVIVMSILVILLTAGLPVTLSFIRTYTLQSERDTFVSLLEWARDQSLNNQNQTSHGVKITPDAYIGFVGTSYAARNAAFDLVYPRSPAITVTGTTEVVFSSINGRTTTSNFSLNNGANQQAVAVNSEGAIDW